LSPSDCARSRPACGVPQRNAERTLQAAGDGALERVVTTVLEFDNGVPSNV
jgi:hypothetical protein